MWLAQALAKNTAVLVCNCSYQPNMIRSRGSTASIIECTATGKRAIGMCDSLNSLANAYRSELMGIYADLATALAVTTLHNIASSSLNVGCDNEGALYLSSLKSEI